MPLLLFLNLFNIISMLVIDKIIKYGAYTYKYRARASNNNTNNVKPIIVKYMTLIL